MRSAGQDILVHPQEELHTKSLCDAMRTEITREVRTYVMPKLHRETMEINLCSQPRTCGYCYRFTSCCDNMIMLIKMISGNNLRQMYHRTTTA
jgi:hypothetical protein